MMRHGHSVILNLIQDLSEPRLRRNKTCIHTGADRAFDGSRVKPGMTAERELAA
jgi:hypothetical protein